MDPRTRTESCIDLSLCSTSVTLDFQWQIDHDLHNSDHFPLIVTLNTTYTIDKPMRWHFSGTDWEVFSNLSKCVESPQDFHNINDMVNYFNTTVITAATACIRRSSGRGYKKCVP